MPAGEDGFTLAKGRKARKPTLLIHCTKASCTGTCPRSVVEQGLRGSGYTPARCRECNKPYKLVPGTAPATQGKVQGGKQQRSTNEASRLQQLQAENKSLKAQCKSLQATAAQSSAPPYEAGADEGVANADKLAAKALQRKIQALKDMDPELRDQLCENMGGYTTFLAQLEGELQQAWARQRVHKPLAQQKASAEAHLKKRQKGRDEAATELHKLLEQQAELEAQLAQQKTVLAEAEVALQQAKLDLVAIAEKATAELRGDGSPGSFDQTSLVTAAAVRDYFQRLPASVAEHNEGQHVIQTVMALLDRLDAAAKAAQAASVGASTEQAPTPAPADPAGDDEDMVGHLLDQLAEAAVPPDDGASDGGEARKARVAATRDRLKAKRTDLETSLSKIRRTVVKR